LGASRIGGDRIAAVAALVGRGEWTTYGEIARVALGGRGARVVGGAAARGRLANAHRILLAGGRISPGWGGGRADECRLRLEAEGIRFREGRADPARHLTWLDLAARSETRARLRS
jgi:alkylated DNA nucleotide flippase Atl1